MSNNLTKPQAVPTEGTSMTTAQLRKQEIDAFIEGKKLDAELAKTNLAIAQAGEETAKTNLEIAQCTERQQHELINKKSFLADRERIAAIVYMFFSAAFLTAIGIYILCH